MYCIGDIMPIIPQASSAAGRVDSVFFFILILCAAFLVFITAAIVYFVIKYNRKRHPKGEDIEGNKWLEVIWTAVPTALFLVMFLYGWTNYSYMREVPREAMVIEVTGRQWAWSFSYPNGKRTSDLVLAVDKPVKLELRSLDVIHGFFIPAFRVKQDVVPGKQNYTWFIPTQLGSFDIECTVICGVSHANMLAKAIVVPISDFEQWYFGGEDTPLPEQARPSSPKPVVPASEGMKILGDKSCLACHSIDGSASVGPSLKGLYGKTQIVLDHSGSEREVTVDDAYLARAVMDPNAEEVKGYPAIMPETPVIKAELQQIVDFIKTLK
jgi:cytochrome c oxidase subunit 2